MFVSVELAARASGIRSLRKELKAALNISSPSLHLRCQATFGVAPHMSSATREIPKLVFLPLLHVMGLSLAIYLPNPTLVQELKPHYS